MLLRSLTSPLAQMLELRTDAPFCSGCAVIDLPEERLLERCEKMQAQIQCKDDARREAACYVLQAELERWGDLHGTPRGRIKSAGVAQSPSLSQESSRATSDLRHPYASARSAILHLYISSFGRRMGKDEQFSKAKLVNPSGSQTL